METFLYTILTLCVLGVRAAVTRYAVAQQFTRAAHPPSAQDARM